MLLMSSAGLDAISSRMNEHRQRHVPENLLMSHSIIAAAQLQEHAHQLPFTLR